MTRVSMASVRATNPGCRIALLTDKQTERNLISTGDCVLDEADRCIIKSVGSDCPQYANRFLKTRSRELINGPFLYLDSDTIVRGDLSPICSLKADLCGAKNDQGPSTLLQMGGNTAIFDAMQWPYPVGPYINGGVLFLSDSSACHRFAKTWHRLWLESHEKTGLHFDQPALNRAISLSGVSFELMSNTYNAQITANPQSAASAVLWHYYGSSPNKTLLESDRVISKLIKNQALDHNVISRLITHFHPWRRDSFIDDMAAFNLLNSANLDKTARDWINRTGRHWKAAIKIFSHRCRAQIYAAVRRMTDQ